MTFKRAYAASVALCLCWHKFSSIDKPSTGAALCAYWHTQIEGEKETSCLPNQYKKGEKTQKKTTTQYHVNLPAEVSSSKSVVSIILFTEADMS